MTYGGKSIASVSECEPAAERGLGRHVTACRSACDGRLSVRWQACRGAAKAPVYASPVGAMVSTSLCATVAVCASYGASYRRADRCLRVARTLLYRRRYGATREVYNSWNVAEEEDSGQTWVAFAQEAELQQLQQQCGRDDHRNPETAWRKDGDWKARYSKLYSSRGISLPKKEEPRRISFMGNDTTPYAALLMKLRASRQDCSDVSTTSCLTSLLTERSECYGTRQGSQQSENLAGHDTLLLDMVRSRSREVEDEVKDQPLALPTEEIPDESQNINDMCIHGYNLRTTTERSMSRSRFSRISMRRDMDIPSILAFTTSTSAPASLGIPAFQKAEEKRVDIPRWSIRRSVCPVCSQKWRDRSSINNVKYSGLKRNSTMELPSIIAPARLRSSVTSGYVPRPVPMAEDKEAGIVRGGFRNTSAAWQLTRARRFRAPKPQPPPPEATAPPSCSAPTARKDLDLRVSRFLSDEF